MFFRAFYLFVCHNDFTTSTFCMTIYIKKSFFPGEYDYSTLCRYWSHCDSSRHSPNNIDFIEYQFLYMKQYAINSATAVVRKRAQPQHWIIQQEFMRICTKAIFWIHIIIYCLRYSIWYTIILVVLKKVCKRQVNCVY